MSDWSSGPFLAKLRVLVAYVHGLFWLDGRSGTFGVTGPAALEAYAAGSLSNVVDAVAAVTCEAFKVRWDGEGRHDHSVLHLYANSISILCVCGYQAFTDPLDPKNLDPHRPHRGQITSATNLRLCLEGSSLVNKRADAKSPDPDAIRCIPQVGQGAGHGPGWQPGARQGQGVDIAGL